MKGFTLVELLIVIALIAILSVAVLATINPIEQSNKAKDSTVQNDAAEVMNSYERYYANAQAYPWMKYGTIKATVETPLLLTSNNVGFGVCDAGTITDEPNTISTCSVTSTNPGLLINTDELKTAFVGKDEFKNVSTSPENGLWLYKQAGSGGSVYVCYIPKAKSNREPTTNQLYCLSNNVPPTRLDSRVDAACVVPIDATAWGKPDAALSTGTVAIFKCVP